jgi:hypothetical protein
MSGCLSGGGGEERRDLLLGSGCFILFVGVVELLVIKC